MELTTADGVTLVSDLYRGGPDAFILGHGNNGDRSALEGLAAGLAREGLTVLNLDFRGHGESSGDGVARNIVTDLDAAARLVRAEGAQRVFVVGLQMGGTAALDMAIDGEAGFDGVVAMFAPPTYHGLNAEAGLDQVTVPTMYFSTDVRGGSVKWANQLHDRAPEPKRLMILPAVPTGVRSSTPSGTTSWAACWSCSGWRDLACGGGAVQCGPHRGARQSRRHTCDGSSRAAPRSSRSPGRPRPPPPRKPA